jgi:hypothetical protein
MKYSQFFSKLLLEQELPYGGNEKTFPNNPDALSKFLDNDTDDDSLDIGGMPDLDADLNGFLSAIEDFKAKKDAYVKKAQTLLDYYSNALDGLSDSKSVTASSVKIRDSVGGLNALENIVKRLEEIVKQSQDKGSTEDIERMLVNARAAKQSSMSDNMSRGNPSSTGPSSLGMSYSESRKRKRRPLRG